MIIVLIIFFINKSKKIKLFEEQKRQPEEKTYIENQLREQIKVKEIAEEKVVEEVEKKAENRYS